MMSEQLLALRNIQRVLAAAVEFRSVAEQYLNDSDYELDFSLSENDATIFVNGQDALNSINELIEKEVSNNAKT